MPGSGQRECGHGAGQNTFARGRAAAGGPAIVKAIREHWMELLTNLGVAKPPMMSPWSCYAVAATLGC